MQERYQVRANLTQQAGYKKRQMNQRFYLEAYQRAGDRFLAARLECVFKVLETPEDIALHNDMVKEISALLMHEKYTKQWFIHRVAGVILHKTGDFYRMVASNLRLAAQKGITSE